MMTNVRYITLWFLIQHACPNDWLVDSQRMLRRMLSEFESSTEQSQSALDTWLPKAGKRPDTARSLTSLLDARKDSPYKEDIEASALQLESIGVLVAVNTMCFGFWNLGIQSVICETVYFCAW